MNKFVNKKIHDFNPKTLLDKINALEQTLQEIVLSIFSDLKLFDKIAFCGGTSLRIFYSLPRFSEDLDFTLIDNSAIFDLSQYFNKIKLILKEYNFDCEFVKFKNNKIQSVFLKTNLSENLKNGLN